MKRNSLMMQLRNLMIAMTLASAFVLGACVMEAPESDEVTEQALESTEAAPSQEILQSSQDELQPEAICPRNWTCDSLGYFFSSQSQCIAACGGDHCYRDYDCTGACICP